MWDWTPAARRALNGSHTAVTRVYILHSGKPVYTLAATGGSVNMDATRPVRSNLAATLVDPTEQLTRGDAGDLLNAYECEIAVYRGVAYGPKTDRVTELAPLGVYQLTSRQAADTPDGLVITLAGQDRSIIFQGPMPSAVTISAGTPIETAIRRLLSARQAGLAMQSMQTGFTCGPLVFGPDIDVWAEAQKLAESAGARLFLDREGNVTLSAIGTASDLPVSRFAEGGGRLLTLDRTEDTDTIRNVVVAENDTGTIRVTVEDTDPTSPTYALGRYGRRVYSMKNPYFGSVKQATAAAAARLAYELGRSETVNFTAVPDPGQDVDEVVTVHRPRAGLTDRGLIVATVDVPLAASEPMKVGCRQSRLALDGRTLTEPKAV